MKNVYFLTASIILCFLFCTLVGIEQASAAAPQGTAVQKVKPGTLSGIVQDASGKKMANAKVQILDDNGKVVGEAVSNEHGLYQIKNLPEGNYTLMVGKTTVANLVVSPDATVSTFMVVMPRTPLPTDVVNWTIVGVGVAVVAVAVPVVKHNQENHHRVYISP